MPLKKPKDDDIKKLHAEVNQLVNQRFLLSTLAVTIFGVITAWVMKEPPAIGAEVGWFRYLTSIVLLVVLTGLFYLMHRLRAMLRIISTYLVETKSSNWEIDWEKYREKPYASYTKAQTWMFIVLGFLASIIPFVTAFAYQLSGTPYVGAICVGLAGVVYMVILFGIAHLNWFDPETDAKSRWQEINNLGTIRKKK
jgi:hypothetical protein